MAKRKWITKGRLAIIIALFTLGFSVYMYYETTRPHTQFEEVATKLTKTLDFLNETEGKVNEKENLGENVIEFKEMLQEARVLYRNAENAWIHGDYDKAEEFLENSYAIISEVHARVVVVVAWATYAIILVIAVLVLAAIAIFRKR